MPSTINADNGVSSGSAGLKSTADSSGVLSLQTNGTTAVTVDTSQNVGVGTASPAYKLDVNGVVKNTGAFRSISGSVDGIFGAGQFASGVVGLGSVSNHPLTFNTNLTEYMRIDSSGNVGIGTSSPAAKLETYNSAVNAAFAPNTLSTWRVAQIRNDGTANAGSAAGIAFVGRTDVQPAGIAAIQSTTGGGNTSLSFMYVGGNITYEGMRLNNSGYLLVGTTSGSGNARLVVNNGNNVSGDFGFVTTLGSNCSNTSSYHYIAATGGADKFYVYGNGSAANATGSYGTISDIKLKENIVDATPKLADVMRLQVRNFNLKTEPTHKQIGFVAQEFEQVFPGMVDESPDRDTNGNVLETTTKHIKTSVLVPILVKAIQELKAEVDSLKSQLAAKG